MFLYIMKHDHFRLNMLQKTIVHINSSNFSSLSKTTKLILLDSLLQEVCISSASMGRSP